MLSFMMKFIYAECPKKEKLIMMFVMMLNVALLSVMALYKRVPEETNICPLHTFDLKDEPTKKRKTHSYFYFFIIYIFL